MSTSTPAAALAEVDYPESDGLPMADNEIQYEWIVTIKGGLDGVFRNDPDVFVAGNMFWYPVQGDNKTVLAPDVMVALGRPKGGRRRGSYRQWQEDGIAPQVVFEVLSPGNTPREMQAKREFYERHGVDEYYEFDPDPEPVALRGWLRQGEAFVEIRPISGWVSPKLGIRFELGNDLTIYRPDGRRFETFGENERLAEEQQLRANEADRRAEEQRLRAEEQRHRAIAADQRAQEERSRADEERSRAERLAARLRALGLDADE